MLEITGDMEAIIKQAILSFVATVNEDGTPNLSPKASLTVRNAIGASAACATAIRFGSLNAAESPCPKSTG
jgi:hypothetical protein